MNLTPIICKMTYILVLLAFGIIGSSALAASNPTCPVGTILCNGTCINSVDLLNCGSCGNACPAGTACVKGNCSCLVGLELCNGTCVDLGGDKFNCGTCAKTCPPDETCINGVCSNRPANVCTDGYCSAINSGQFFSHHVYL